MLVFGSMQSRQSLLYTSHSASLHAGFEEPKSGMQRAVSKGRRKAGDDAGQRRGLASTKEESEGDDDEDESPFAARTKPAPAARRPVKSEIQAGTESDSDGDTNPFAKRVAPRQARPAEARKYDDDDDVSPLESESVSMRLHYGMLLVKGKEQRACIQHQPQLAMTIWVTTFITSCAFVCPDRKHACHCSHPCCTAGRG